jgi:DNA-binding transcriptional regulator YhcF (GntR family)
LRETETRVYRKAGKKMDDEEMKELIKRLIQALQTKGWTGEEITELLVQILETK